MAKTKTPKPSRSAAQAARGIHRVARPDAVDFRDRPFRPNVSVTPALTRFPDIVLPVKHQGETNACTGFALSLVVEYLLRRSGRDPKAEISPYMLYSMARRYDEFPGSVQDSGSSARGALKGWYKHGACRLTLFDALAMPPASDTLDDDWWFDAVKRPLGAYYRIDPKSIVDMHAALNEVGILYVTSGCHSGWDEGWDAPQLKRRPSSFKAIWTIPRRGGQAEHPGHAYAIVGYDETGFLIQNSWGTEWGSHGYALLPYDDWIANAMDCWVAQLGVVTHEHRAIAASMTLRSDTEGKVKLAANEVLRNREIAPFIVNMGNNGALSNSGDFRTQPDDVRAIADVQLALARDKWGLKGKSIDVCIYAHGGLVGERAAASIAARWIPALYDAQVFPVFMMWETDAWSTITGRISDAVRDVPRTAGGFGDALERWWNRRLERVLSRPGTTLWGEMKQNADAMSAFRKGVADDEQAGAVLLYRHFKHKVADKQVRLHLVGHSAGSIVASFMIDRLVADGMRLESLSLMAPAVRVDTFDRLVAPQIETGVVKRFQSLHLTERAEEDDPTCGPYRRSLLHLVSESFEGGTRTPILGMQTHFDAWQARRKLPNTTSLLSPGPKVASSTHGGFDEDPGALAQVIDFIKGR
ncbi:MAG TPA: C1 family peptidase [Methylibium sp.]|nr:C1 family peptidase [Methylibium sp.]